MMARLAFYFAEALVLAGVCSGALYIACNAARRLGWSPRLRWPWIYAGSWALLFVVGVAGGEWRGPEFLVAYSLTGKAVLIAVIAWLASFPLARRVRVTPLPASGESAADAVSPQVQTPQG